MFLLTFIVKPVPMCKVEEWPAEPRPVQVSTNSIAQSSRQTLCLRRAGLVFADIYDDETGVSESRQLCSDSRRDKEQVRYVTLAKRFVETSGYCCARFVVLWARRSRSSQYTCLSLVFTRFV